MTELKSFITMYWSTITDWALMIIAYFLVFLFKAKTNGTAQNINLAFTELKTKFDENTKNAETQLNASIEKYKEAVDTISILTKKVQRLEETLFILLDDEEAEDDV